MSPEQYFESEPNVASAERSVELTLPDRQLTLATDRGVFSVDRVDSGTKYLLLEAPMPDDGATVLDVGCGYGPIAVTVALRCPRSAVWAIDVNERARDLCARNARTGGASNVEVVEPDSVPEALGFDAIYSNPPIRIGKPALHALLERWLDRLTPDGYAVLVVQKHLGADSLARWMTTQGWSNERIGSRQGYRLLQVRAR